MLPSPQPLETIVLLSVSEYDYSKFFMRVESYRTCLFATGLFHLAYYLEFHPGSSVSKESACDAGPPESIPG